MAGCNVLGARVVFKIGWPGVTTWPFTMKSYVQVLGAGSRECASHSLYYFLEQNRMLFNVSEGLQRLATQHRLKIAPNKMNAVFLTRLDWDCFGGLPGLILTMGDTARLVTDSDASPAAGVLRIVGPRHAKHALAAMRPFLHRRDFSVEVEELCVTEAISHWRDAKADVDVWAMELAENEQAAGAAIDEDDARDGKTGNVTIEEMEPHHFLLRMFQSEFSVQASQPEREERCEEFSGRLSQAVSYDGPRSLVYVVQGPTQPGKFDKAAAMARGIKPGPLFGQLSRGESVTLPNGSVIEPDCCVGPKRASPAFMILDIATASLARAAFKSSETLRELMAKPSGSAVEVVIHLLGEEVSGDAALLREYREFCAVLTAEAPAAVKHFFCAPNDAVLMSSSVDLQLALADSLNAPQFFPSGRQAANFLASLEPQLLKPLDRVTIVPGEDVQLERTETVLSGVGPDDLASTDETGIWVSTLGTGSAIPGKYRNVTSNFIENYGTDEMIFLDCGEMTIGQMYRLFGRKRAEDLMKRTAALLISHKHGDHHLGALSLIKKIVETRGKVVLIAPERFKIWMQEFAQVSDFGMASVEFVPCGEIREVPFKFEGSGTEIKAFDVDHCLEAFGFQITFASKERIVYSGDTRPCDSVIDNAHDCDLLVHEATMSNDLIHEAVMRKHCTIEEAVSVGVRSKSRALLLTHFSQRYAKGALSLDPSTHGNVKVAMGVDLLRFPLKEVGQVSALASKMSDLLPVDKAEDLDADMHEK